MLYASFCNTFWINLLLKFAYLSVNLKPGSPFVNLLVHQKELPDSAVVLDRLFSNEQIK